LQSIGVNDRDLAARLNAVYLKHRFEDIQLYADVLPAFTALRNRYMLGLVSNGNSYPSAVALTVNLRSSCLPTRSVLKSPIRRFSRQLVAKLVALLINSCTLETRCDLTSRGQTL
jgi:hypothetical protein